MIGPPWPTTAHPLLAISLIQYLSAYPPSHPSILSVFLLYVSLILPFILSLLYLKKYVYFREALLKNLYDFQALFLLLFQFSIQPSKVFNSIKMTRLNILESLKRYNKFSLLLFLKKNRRKFKLFNGINEIKWNKWCCLIYTPEILHMIWLCKVLLT